MVPCNRFTKSMVLAPGVALATAISALKEPVTPSFRLGTVKVLGDVRSARTSEQGTNDRRKPVGRRTNFRPRVGSARFSPAPRPRPLKQRTRHRTNPPRVNRSAKKVGGIGPDAQTYRPDDDVPVNTVLGRSFHRPALCCFLKFQRPNGLPVHSGAVRGARVSVCGAMFRALSTLPVLAARTMPGLRLGSGSAPHLGFLFLSIHKTACLYHWRASSWWPSFPWAMARNSQSTGIAPLP